MQIFKRENVTGETSPRLDGFEEGDSDEGNNSGEFNRDSFRCPELNLVDEAKYEEFILENVKMELSPQDTEGSDYELDHITPHP